jgi:hypothetical protein
MAPSSRPRVGWLARITLGPADSTRPRISFCMLPPDRSRMRVSGVAPRTSNRSISPAAWSRAAALRTKPRVAKSGVVSRSSTLFSQTESSPTTPSAWRSSGMRPTPSAMKARGPRPADLPPLQHQPPLRRCRHTRQKRPQRRLPVARYADDAEDLARMHGEGHVLERRLAVEMHGHVLGLQARRADLVRLPLRPGHAAADHQLRQLLRRGLGRLAFRHLPPAAQAPRPGRRPPSPRSACGR